MIIGIVKLGLINYAEAFSLQKKFLVTTKYRYQRLTARNS